MTPDEFRNARKALGLSQPGAATALGVHHATVARWEQGRTRIPYAIELALATLQERTTMANFDLPTGWTSIDDLAQCMAGAAFIVGRTLPRFHDLGTIESSAIIPVAETIEGDHPECWIDRFYDGSIWMHSNGVDEVWADGNDFLSDRELDSLQAAVRAA